MVTDLHAYFSPLVICILIVLLHLVSLRLFERKPTSSVLHALTRLNQAKPGVYICILHSGFKPSIIQTFLFGGHSTPI